MVAQWTKTDATNPYLTYTHPRMIPPAAACANLPSLHGSPSAMCAKPNRSPTATITASALL